MAESKTALEEIDIAGVAVGVSMALTNLFSELFQAGTADPVRTRDNLRRMAGRMDSETTRAMLTAISVALFGPGGHRVHTHAASRRLTRSQRRR